MLENTDNIPRDVRQKLKIWRDQRYREHLFERRFHREKISCERCPFELDSHSHEGRLSRRSPWSWLGWLVESFEASRLHSRLCCSLENISKREDRLMSFGSNARDIPNGNYVRQQSAGDSIRSTSYF